MAGIASEAALGLGEGERGTDHVETKKRRGRWIPNPCIRYQGW